MNINYVKKCHSRICHLLNPSLFYYLDENLDWWTAELDSDGSNTRVRTAYNLVLNAVLPAFKLNVFYIGALILNHRTRVHGVKYQFKKQWRLATPFVITILAPIFSNFLGAIGDDTNVLLNLVLERIGHCVWTSVEATKNDLFKRHLMGRRFYRTASILQSRPHLLYDSWLGGFSISKAEP